MRNITPALRALPRLALAALAAGCGGDATRVEGTAPATITLHQAGAAPLASAALGWAGGLVGGHGVIAPSSVDSLVVTVTRVEVLPESLLGLRPPPLAEGRRGFGMPGLGGRPGRPGRPGLRMWMRDSAMIGRHPWGELADDWIALQVVGGGRIDLVHLPTEAEAGIVIAAGDVPPGDYVHARLFVSDAMIWFNTPIPTAQGDTLRSDTGYAVFIPSAEQSGIKTDAGFTIPEGGGQVQLVFEPGATLAGALVTGEGRIIIAPVLRHRRW